MTKLLPTSTAGSLPKPSWLADPEKLWSDWKLQGDDCYQPKVMRCYCHCLNNSTQVRYYW